MDWPLYLSCFFLAIAARIENSIICARWICLKCIENIPESFCQHSSEHGSMSR